MLLVYCDCFVMLAPLHRWFCSGLLLALILCSAANAAPVSKKKRIEEVKLALQQQMATDSPDESAEEPLEVNRLSCQPDVADQFIINRISLSACHSHSFQFCPFASPAYEPPLV